MPCRPNCGACCDPVYLDQAYVDRAFVFGPLQPQAQWISDHWAPREHTKDGVRFDCVNYDAENRACLAYDSRPPVCSGFPMYGRDTPEGISNVCGYQAEAGRTVLPLVQIT